MNLEEVKTVLDLAKLWNDMGSQISDLFLNAFMAVEKKAIELREQLMESQGENVKLRHENKRLRENLPPELNIPSALNVKPPTDKEPYYRTEKSMPEPERENENSMLKDLDDKLNLAELRIKRLEAEKAIIMKAITEYERENEKLKEHLSPQKTHDSSEKDKAITENDWERFINHIRQKTINPIPESALADYRTDFRTPEQWDSDTREGK